MPTVCITNRNLHPSVNSIFYLTTLQFLLFLMLLYAMPFVFNWHILNPIQITFSSLTSLEIEIYHSPISCSMQLGSNLLKSHDVFASIFMWVGSCTLTKHLVPVSEAGNNSISKSNKGVSLISRYKYFYWYSYPGWAGLQLTQDPDIDFPLEAMGPSWADWCCHCHEPDRSKGRSWSVSLVHLYFGSRALACQVCLSQPVPCFGSWHRLGLLPTGSLGTATVFWRLRFFLCRCGQLMPYGQRMGSGTVQAM